MSLNQKQPDDLVALYVRDRYEFWANKDGSEFTWNLRDAQMFTRYEAERILKSGKYEHLQIFDSQTIPGFEE